VLEFPVIKIAEKDIVDTNGAGDAFVGGKLSFSGFHTSLPSSSLTVLHDSADAVVRAMSVKYRQWCSGRGGSCNFETS